MTNLDWVRAPPWCGVECLGFAKRVARVDYRFGWLSSSEEEEKDSN